MEQRYDRPYYTPTIRRTNQDLIDSRIAESKHTVRTDQSTEWLSTGLQSSRCQNDQPPSPRGSVDSDSQAFRKVNAMIQHTLGLSQLVMYCSRKQTIYGCVFLEKLRHSTRADIQRQRRLFLGRILVSWTYLKSREVKQEAFGKLKNKLFEGRLRSAQFATSLENLKKPFIRRLKFGFGKLFRLYATGGNIIQRNSSSREPKGWSEELEIHDMQYVQEYSESLLEHSSSNIQSSLSISMEYGSAHNFRIEAKTKLQVSSPVCAELMHSAATTHCELMETALRRQPTPLPNISRQLEPLSVNKVTFSSKSKLASLPVNNDPICYDCTDYYQMHAVLSGRSPPLLLTPKVTIHSKQELHSWFDNNRVYKPRQIRMQTCHAYQ